jgi:hypothetical protein
MSLTDMLSRLVEQLDAVDRTSQLREQGVLDEDEVIVRQPKPA